MVIGLCSNQYFSSIDIAESISKLEMVIGDQSGALIQVGFNMTTNIQNVNYAERITSLDAIRGIAALGILPMNALSFGLTKAAYLNITAGGIHQPLDWIIGILTMTFIDQKMMGLFSLLFGVGVVIFAERAAIKNRRVGWLSLWRFTLLLFIGIAHGTLWLGDILFVYAVCAPIVLLVRKFPARLLISLGVLLAIASALATPFFQGNVSPGGKELGDLWFADGGYPSDVFGVWLLLDAFGRALGFMLIGVGLFQLGIVQGQKDDAYYRQMAQWGIGVGTAITVVGIVFQIINNWSPEYALTGHIPTGLGTIPMALGYMALIIMWNRSGSRFVEPFRAVGKMALTNYLTQTILGLTMLAWWLSEVDLGRTMIAIWIIGIWILQLRWSTWWLKRFQFGPFEWLWRCATYRELKPMRIS